MIVKYSRTTNFSFLLSYFCVLKFDEYLKLPVTNTYENINIHPKKLIRQLCVVPIDQNSVNMHSKPRDILLPQNKDIRHGEHQ
jgi:hypothetical protein